ncbi:hypothetical protein WDU94_012731, partial [Cyamophila willieti]
QVTVTVDNVFSEQGSTAGAFTFLTTSKAFIGGSENPRDLPGSTVHSNFVGCLRRVSCPNLALRTELCFRLQEKEIVTYRILKIITNLSGVVVR